MLPLKLTIQAFGPYKNKQEIDFSRLENQKLLLIHGRTGAGKTTILDAICFALYGKVSGNDRGTKFIRNQNANINLETYVEFVFKIGNKIFSVNRKPSQERPKKRGDGTITMNQEASLFENEKLIKSKETDVTTYIKDLIGLEFDQFRQIVILPQGEFQQFLIASSIDRAIILGHIFATEKYKKLQEYLNEQTKQIIKQLDDLNIQQKQVLETAQVESTENVKIVIKQLQDQIKKNEENKEFYANKLKATKIIYENIQNNITNHENLDKLKIKCNNLENQIPHITAQEKTLKLAQKASELKHLLDYDKNYEEQVQNTHNLLIENSKILKDSIRARKILNTLMTKYETLEKSEKLLIEKKTAYIYDSKNLPDSKSRKERQINLETEKENLAKTQTNLKKLNEHLDKQTDLQKILYNEEIKNERLKQDLLKIEELGKAARDKQNQETELKKYKQEFNNTESLKIESTAQIKEINTKLEQAETNTISFYTAVLSANLTKGNPCPVCGSKEHETNSSEAKNISQNNPEHEQIKQLKINLNTAQNKLNRIIESQNVLNSQIAGLQASLKPLCLQIGENSIESLLKIHSTKKTESDICNQKIEKIKSDLNNLNTQKEEKLKLEKFIETTQEKINQLLYPLKAEETKIINLAKKYNTKIDFIYNHLENYINKADLRLLFFSNQKLELTAKIDNLKNNFNNAKINARTSATNYKDSLKKYKETNIKLKKELHSKGFTDSQSCKDALLSNDIFQSLQIECEQFRTELNAANGDIANLEKQISAPKFSAEELEIAKQNTEKEELSFTNFLQESGRIEARLATYFEYNEQLNKIKDKYTKLEKQHGISAQLSEIINGSGQNTKKITFERYILGALFDDVLSCVNERLKIMTQSRYTLLRSTEQSDKRKGFGLDIEVFDEHTGYARPPGTLSGGERFIASLALALGLSDTVQSYAGGIHLDSIFIDEGFANLDTESLRIVMDALLGQLGQHKLIGIISHVDELKELINAKLEIITEKNDTHIILKT